MLLCILSLGARWESTSTLTTTTYGGFYTWSYTSTYEGSDAHGTGDDILLAFLLMGILLWAVIPPSAGVPDKAKRLPLKFHLVPLVLSTIALAWGFVRMIQEGNEIDYSTIGLRIDPAVGPYAFTFAAVFMSVFAWRVARRAQTPSPPTTGAAT